MPQLSPELERRLTTAVDRMPVFPKSVQTILEMTRNINCRPKSLVGVIEKDPVMTMKILRVINSAYYGLPNKISSVGQSVVYLGSTPSRTSRSRSRQSASCRASTRPASTSSAICCIR